MTKTDAQQAVLNALEEQLVDGKTIVHYDTVMDITKMMSIQVLITLDELIDAGLVFRSNDYYYGLGRKDNFDIAVEALNEKLDQLGFDFALNGSEFKLDGQWYTIVEDKDIALDNIGPLKAIFKNATVTSLKIGGVAEKAVSYRLDIRWEHPRGSNGYDLNEHFYFGNGAWE